MKANATSRARFGAAVSVCLLAAGCGGGGESDVKNDPAAATPPAAQPAPVESTPAPAPEPGPGPTPSPSPSPSPSPAGIELEGGYPTERMQCSVGTPMKLARQFDVNYNGGVIRFVPVGEREKIVIWQVSNLSVQQHESSATFSAPTTDGRQAWLNISQDGKINGAGYHGMTADSYLRCGDAQNGVESVGVQTKLLACRSGVSLDADGNPNPGGPVEYDYQTWQIDYDFSTYPYKSIVNVTRPEYSFGDYHAAFIVNPDFQFNGAPATAVYPSGFIPPIYYFVDEELVGVTKGGRFTFMTGWECGNF